MSSGFDRADLSFLAAEKTVEEKLEHKYRKVAELEDDASVPRCCYVSTESVGDAEGGVVGGSCILGRRRQPEPSSPRGTLAAAIAAAALAGGAGGVIGSILAKWIGDHHARHLQEQLEHGGLLLWARTWNAEEEERAVEILAKHSGRDVHVHAVPAFA